MHQCLIAVWTIAPVHHRSMRPVEHFIRFQSVRPMRRYIIPIINEEMSI
jgi:hypothetical protein